MTQSPYKTLELVREISLYPEHFNRNIESNIRDVLVEIVKKRTFENIGYITEVNDILDISGGFIRADDPMSPAIYRVKFSCEIGVPIINDEILFKIKDFVKGAIVCDNDQLKCVIPSHHINKDNFKVGQNKNFYYKNEMLQKGNIIIVKIISITFNRNEIFILGFLQDMANDDQISEYYSVFHKNN